MPPTFTLTLFSFLQDLFHISFTSLSCRLHITSTLLLRLKTEGRPLSALIKKRTAQEADFENFTRREPSSVGYKEANQRRKTLRERVQEEWVQGKETQGEGTQEGETSDGGLTTGKPRGKPRERPKGGSQEQLTQNEEVREGTQGERTQKKGTQGGGTQEGGQKSTRWRELEEVQVGCQMA